MKTIQLLLTGLLASFIFKAGAQVNPKAAGDICYASGAAISSLEFSPSKKYLAINTENGNTKVYDLATLQVMVTAHRNAYQASLKTYLEDGALVYSSRPKYYYEGMVLGNGNTKVNILDSLKRILTSDIVRYKDPSATYFFGAMNIKTGSFVMNDENAIAWFKPTGSKTLIKFNGPAPDVDYRAQYSPSGKYLVLRDGNIILLEQGKIIKCDFDLRNKKVFNPSFSGDELNFTIFDHNIGLITYEATSGKRTKVVQFPATVIHNNQMEATLLPDNSGFVIWEDDDNKTVNDDN